MTQLEKIKSIIKSSINPQTGEYKFTLKPRQKKMLQDILCETGLNINSLFKLTPEQVKTVESVLNKNNYDVSERRFLNALRLAVISNKNKFIVKDPYRIHRMKKMVNTVI